MGRHYALLNVFVNCTTEAKAACLQCGVQVLTTVNMLIYWARSGANYHDWPTCRISACHLWRCL